MRQFTTNVTLVFHARGDSSQWNQQLMATLLCKVLKISLSLVLIAPFSRSTGWLVGQIEGQEAAKGNILPISDLIIGASAIEQGYAVLTSNVRHFRRIPGLIVVPF